LRAKSLRDYEGLLRRYVRLALGTKALETVSAFGMDDNARDLLLCQHAFGVDDDQGTVFSAARSISCFPRNGI
jgi:hypothetical protein